MIGVVWLLSCQVAAPSTAAQPTAASAADRAADFDQMWHEVTEGYVYLGDKAAAWAGVRSRYGARVARAHTLDEWTSVLANALSELGDFHIEVDPRPRNDWRPVPTCAMVWAEWRDGLAVITGVQPGGNAARAGVQPGDTVQALDGRDIATAVPASLSPTMRNHLLLQLLAGRTGTDVTIQLAAPRQPAQSVRLRTDCAVDRPSQPVSVSRSDRGYGVIRFNNSLGDGRTVPAFDQALDSLQDAPGLILDLRDTLSGGNSSVALGILGRFITARAPYQMHRIPNYGQSDIERVWLEEASPRGPFTYTKPLVVLADHWTGSMGEGIAVGLDALRRATAVGTSMGRLNGSVQAVTLDRTHVEVHIPEEQTFHVNGTPRHEWNPPVLVDLTAARGQIDPEMAAAERALADLELEARPIPVVNTLY